MKIKDAQTRVKTKFKLEEIVKLMTHELAF
jgi:hypothetical protein